MMRDAGFARASEFPDGALVSHPFHIARWPVVGKPLEVPAGHRAVLTGSDGGVRVLKEGFQSLQGLPCGLYMAQWVDVRRRHLEVPAVRALTRDGWQAGVQASLEYRARSPRAVVQIDDPIKALREAAVFAITSAIKTVSHDLLIGTSDRSNGSHEAVAARIQRQLQARLRGSGLQVVNVFVGQPDGDERRLEIKRQSQIDGTQFDAEQKALARKMELEHERQALAVLEAETRRKQAEEEQKIRLEQARIEAQVTRLVQGVREWETRLQLVPDLSRQRHEQILEAIKTHGHILGKMAELGNLEVVGVSSRRRPEELGLDRLEGVLVQGLANLQALLAQGSPALTWDGVGDGQESGVPLLFCLANEINALSTVEGWAWTHLEPDKNGGLCLKARLNGITLEISCRPDFPASRPEIVVSANGHHRVPFLFPWSESRSLKNLVQEIAQRFSGAASTSDDAPIAPAA